MGYILDGAHWNLDKPRSIPNLLFAHIEITLISVALALVIAFPLALLVVRFTRLNFPVQTIAGVIYTIPSLALFVFLIPITGLNPPTVIIPLVAYAQVVLIRNIVAAIRAVDPALLEVGRAMGMDGAQLQRRVVLPLALPIIVAGIRVATVTSIGIASLGFIVGVDTLGRLAFDGISFSYLDETLAGAILITALAVSADLLLLGIQTLLNRGGQATLGAA